jgi:acyl-CoA thioester hydrolase
MNSDKAFQIELETRDYECDLQGIINNAVYLNYFEHTRHRFLRYLGLDFARMHDTGIDPVLRKAEIEYRRSLRSGDRFSSVLKVAMKGRFQLLFEQSIVRLPSREEIAESRNYVAFVRGEKPIPRPVEVDRALEEWWKEE